MVKSAPTTEIFPVPRTGNFPIVLAGIIWLALALGASWALMSYSNQPGASGSSPVSWPEVSHLVPPVQQPALVMFVHPKCPCSRATISELALLMAHCPGRVRADVFFLQPAGTSEAWVATDLWYDAARIPGVTLHRDDLGHEANVFGAETSGDTLLYSPNGKLLFHGGITIARGHSGDNPGRDAIEALLSGEISMQNQTRVFGCSLFQCSLAGTK
jgi:hypothetical protein